MLFRRPALLLLLFCALPATAEIYVYYGPDGQKISPLREKGFNLIGKRENLKNVGQMLVNRPIAIGGTSRFERHIRRASDRYGVDVALIEAVIQVESNFNPNAVSRRGAIGLMQLMQETARQYRVANAYNPEENINAGVRHLSYLLERFRGRLPLVLAAYNAGAGTVDRFRGIPPYPETRNYVSKVLDFHDYYRQIRYGGK
jgi:soluble lytic murein transglycosylase-like protein|tara:strand:+ start:8426 stop:9028 length:603 start_codon:yes stop_codon:yes gene_type:complete